MENAESEYNQLLALSENLAKMIQMTLANVEKFTSDKNKLKFKSKKSYEIFKIIKKRLLPMTRSIIFCEKN